MAQITITIPDAKLNAVIDAFATQYNYQENIPNPEGAGEVSNPVSKAQFARNIVNSFVKEVYVAAQVKDLEIQREQTIATANSDVSDITTE